VTRELTADAPESGEQQSELVRLRIQARLHRTEMERFEAREENLKARVAGLSAQLQVRGWPATVWC
jgi:hypothetical protein